MTGARSRSGTSGLPVVLDPAHEAIRRAEAGVRKAIRRAESDPARPACHFRPPARWMNDPNGTLFHDGWYHLFYQHNPFGDEWGEVHWGHARSRDLVLWEQLPVALAPTPAAGEGHCFSGCGWTDAKGRPVFFYTSWPPGEDGPPGAGGRSAQQWIVRADAGLRRFEKPAANPILRVGCGGVPAFEPDWRDPFVFEEEGRTFMLVGAARAGAVGAHGAVGAGDGRDGGEAVIAVLESDDPDLERWSYRGILHRSPRSRVAFFECPSLARIDGKHVLIYSAHRPVEYLTGSFDPEAGTFRPEEGGRIDHSAHLYATSPFVREPRGRRILVGWVRGWEAGRGWNGVLGLPRVLALGEDGRLRQRPLPELRRLRAREAGLPPGLRLEREAREVEDIGAPSLEVSATISLAEDEGRAGVRLRRAEDGAVVASVALRRRGGPEGPPGGLEARIRASALGFRLQPDEPPSASTGAGQPSTLAIPLPEIDPTGPVGLHLFWDRSLLEVFLADGREACTLVVDARGEPTGIEAFAEGGSARFASLRAWSLEGIW